MIRFWTISLLMLLSVAAGAIAEDAEWNSIRGDMAGRASIAWPDDEEPPLIREWLFRTRGERRHKLGLAVWASPALAIVNGVPLAFIGGYDQTMHALDIRTRERLWFRITNGEISSAPAVGWVGGRQVVFWGSADRTVYAHFADDGDRLWTRELIQPTSTLGDAILSSPLLHDGVLYITCFVYDRALSRYDQKGWLFALDISDGRPIWKYEVSQGPVGSPVGRVMDGRFIVFVAAQKGQLQALDVSSARPRQLWTYQMPHEVLGAPVVQPEADNPLLFLGSKFGNLKAIDARTGREVWQRMAGNWIDNTATIGRVGGEEIVFVGSHDYNLYAFRADDGDLLWRRRLPGEIFSAPSFFNFGDVPAVTVASHDNHLYVIDARDGEPITAFFTGLPVWELMSKGDTLWGSPAVLEAGERTVIVFGSYSDIVFTLPIRGESLVRMQPGTPSRLWIGVLIVLAVFFAIILPIIMRLPDPGEGEDE